MDKNLTEKQIALRRDVVLAKKLKDLETKQSQVIEQLAVIEKKANKNTDEIKRIDAIPKPVKGDRGETGEGIPGKDGLDGKNGRDGKDGKDGIDGKDGRDGKDGKNGKDGRNGIDGINGIDGKDAQIDEAKIATDVVSLIKDKQLLETDDIKGLRKEISSYRNQLAMKQAGQHGGGDTVAAGTNVTLTRLPNGTTQINSSGIGATFETVSKNLDASGATLAYTGENLTSIAYVNGINKTLNYTGDILTSVVLSGATPSGITLTKTLSYTGENLTGVIYS